MKRVLIGTVRWNPVTKEYDEVPPAPVPCSAAGLRWHLLSAIVSARGFIEVMAASSIDGIGVIARWVLDDGAYRCEAIDTEGCEWAPVDFSDEANEIPPTPPSEWDDSAETQRICPQNAKLSGSKGDK